MKSGLDTVKNLAGELVVMSLYVGMEVRLSCKLIVVNLTIGEHPIVGSPS